MVTLGGEVILLMRVTETKDMYCLHCAKVIKHGTEFHRVFANGMSAAWAGPRRVRFVLIMRTKNVHIKCFYRLNKPIRVTIEEHNELKRQAVRDTELTS